MRLKRLRARAGLSQADLAERANLHRVFIARLETGRQDPGLATLEKLAKALGVKLRTLVE